MNRIYLIRRPNIMSLNLDIYKLFRSRTDPKHCEILFVGVFSDSFTAERDLLYMFSNRFLMYGTKHFQGNPNDMIDIINTYTVRILNFPKFPEIPKIPPISLVNDVLELPDLF